MARWQRSRKSSNSHNKQEADFYFLSVHLLLVLLRKDYPGVSYGTQLSDINASAFIEILQI